MITDEKQNFSFTQFDGETFGDLLKCNFGTARLNDCVFTGTVDGCNFQDAAFSACSFAAAVFTGCNFEKAAGINPAEIAGEVNNFEGVA